MTLAFAFWGWLSALALTLAAFLTIGVITGLFLQGPVYRRRNAAAIITLIAVTPFFYMLAAFLWNIAKGVAP